MDATKAERALTKLVKEVERLGGVCHLVLPDKTIHRTVLVHGGDWPAIAAAYLAACEALERKPKMGRPRVHAWDEMEASWAKRDAEKAAATARVNAALDRGEKPAAEDLVACDVQAMARAHQAAREAHPTRHALAAVQGTMQGTMQDAAPTPGKAGV